MTRPSIGHRSWLCAGLKPWQSRGSLVLREWKEAVTNAPSCSVSYTYDLPNGFWRERRGWSRRPFGGTKLICGVTGTICTKWNYLRQTFCGGDVMQMETCGFWLPSSVQNDLNPWTLYRVWVQQENTIRRISVSRNLKERSYEWGLRAERPSYQWIIGFRVKSAFCWIGSIPALHKHSYPLNSTATNTINFHYNGRTSTDCIVCLCFVSVVSVYLFCFVFIMTNEM